METTYILFDLDGTIIDSKDGVWNSVIYSLKTMGRPIPDTKTLELFIGPPLEYSYTNYCGMTNEEAAEAVRIYREFYSVTGIFQCSLYPGVLETVQSLKEKGYPLYICTSKPGVFAQKIADHLGFSQYFAAIVGCGLNGERNTKKEVIEYTLQEYKIPVDQAVMVGDRKFDMIPAKELGLHTAAALFGFGSREELQSYNPDYLAESFSDLDRIFP